MNSYQNLLNCIDAVEAEGKTPKVIKLPTKKPRKGNLYANRVRGGSTRVRCNGGSRGTMKSTSNSALTDVN
jgi:hypothetical protein